MQPIPLKDFGIGGLNTDLPEYNLPPNLVTIAINVRAHDGAIGNINCGYTTWKTLTDIPLDINAFHDLQDNIFWVISTTDKIIVVDPVDTIIGSGFDNATYWTSDVLTDIPIFCQVKDAPQYWKPVDPVQSVLPLPWDTTDGDDWDNAYGGTYRAHVIRAHKNYLFALNIEDGTSRYPSMVHWSDPADPGFVPSTWKYREPDNRSGRRDLAQTDGAVIDGLSLGDSFLVYKSDSVWRFTFIGGNPVFRSSRIQVLPGILARDCVVEIETGQHVVLSRDDIYIHNGQTFKSLLTNRNRKKFLSLIDSDNADKCYLQVNSQYKEVWVCVPVTGHDSNVPTKAAVWSWEDDTWTERDLTNVTCMTEGPTASPGRILINNAIGSIGSDHNLINSVNTNPENIFLFGGSSNQSIIQFDTGGTNDGVPFVSRLGRQFIQLTDEMQQEAIVEVFPTIQWYGDESKIDIRFGSHYTMRSPIKWDKWKTFDVKIDRHVDPRTTGSYHGFEIMSQNGATWGLSNFLLTMTPDGQR